MRLVQKQEQRVVDVDLELQKWGLDAKVVSPAEMESHSTQMDDLIMEFYEIALDAFGKYLPYEWINDRTRTATATVVVRDQSKRAVAYAVNDRLDLAGVCVNYFASGFIRREYQGVGLYRVLNDIRLDLIPANAIMTRTQNPIVYRGFHRLCEGNGIDLHPANAPIHEMAKSIGKAFSSKADDDLVVSKVYDGRSLMDDTPCPITDTERRIWSKVNVDQGDAVILVGLCQGSYAHNIDRQKGVQTP